MYSKTYNVSSSRLFLHTTPFTTFHYVALKDKRHFPPFFTIRNINISHVYFEQYDTHKYLFIFKETPKIFDFSRCLTGYVVIETFSY